MAEKRTVYRVQDRDGRGPWRPGFSRFWIDNSGPPLPPALHDDFGFEIYSKIRAAKGHCGSACSDVEDLRNWFTPRERKTLQLLGYNPVCLLADDVLAESKHQLVIRCDEPLNSGALVLPWSAMEAKADA